MEAIREQWLIFISTPVYCLLIVAEILLSQLHHYKWYSVKDTFTNIYLLLLNSGIDLGFRVVYLAILQYFFFA